jgi:transcriptional adapter 3
VQQYQVFGEDPSKYPDPTIYHIREITPEMSEEEKKAILKVAHYPPDDLHGLTCGTPPDRDYSQPKPAQQVTFQTFLNYVEPYVRPLTEEDRAFLLERGDREKPFIIPKLGAKHYTEVWAEEDDRIPPHTDIKVTDNEPRGSMDQMNDDVAESEEVSAGPLMSRLLQMLRPGGRNNDNDNIPNGTAEDMDVDGEERREVSKPETQPPPTQLPDWKNAPPMPKPDYVTMDERIKQELVHLGFLSPADPPAYIDSLDDEVCARLRYLQSELRRQSIINGARKARILELAEEHMAGQEWSTISEDLDNQLNQAYLKRNRNIGKKGSKIKRPGGAGGGSHVVGVARAQSTGIAVGVGEPIRGLMERKQKWTEWIGPVVNYGKTKIPEDTIFDNVNMDRLGAKEQESWGEVEDV